MFRFLVATVVVMFGVWLARRGRRAAPGIPARALPLLAIAALTNHLLIEACRPTWLAGLRPLFVAGAALAGLIAFGVIAYLIHRVPKRRDAFFRYPLFGIAWITAMAGAPWGVAAGFTAAGILSFRWKDAFSTRALFRLGLLSVALSFLLLLRWPAAWPEFAEDGPLATLLNLARWAQFVAVFYVIAGVVALFAGFVRDPSLGIRTVGRRLALSHLLVVGVPLVLTLLLWVVTTLVGIGSERARVASHVLEDRGRVLDRGIRAALGAGEQTGAALQQLAADSTAGGEGRAWWVRHGRIERVYGEALPGDSLLLGWFAAADTVPRAGLLSFRGKAWVAAAAGDPHAAAGVVLLPVRPVAKTIADRFTGGRVNVAVQLDREAINAIVDSARAGRAPESDEGARVRFTLRGDTLDTSTFADDTSNVWLMPVGQAIVRSAGYRRGRWGASNALVTVRLEPGAVLGEMVSRARQSELDILPLILVGFFGVLFGLVALFDLVMVVNMGRSITAAIGALARGATQLEAGNLAHRIPVKGEDDLWDVARAFNQAITGLERARELEKERDRLESELALARRIQSRLLPSEPPRVPGWEIAGASESAREVGGDYYDHIDLGGGRIVLVIADVSGKGVPAALLMSAFRAALVSQDLTGAEPSAVARRLNEFLHQSVEPGRFVTAFVAFLDTSTGHMLYVNAGHNPPFLLRADGHIESLSEGGTILGILPLSAFTSGETVLGPGDLLALYTDGVTEGADATGEMWGEDRLLDALRKRVSMPSAQLVREVVDEVRGFEGETGPADDITMLIARRLGGEGGNTA